MIITLRLRKGKRKSTGTLRLEAESKREMADIRELEAKVPVGKTIDSEWTVITDWLREHRYTGYLAHETPAVKRFQVKREVAQ